jgi:hypothetical protein
VSEILSKIYIDLQVKYLLFLSDFNETWTVPYRFSKNTHTPIFMNIRPVGAEVFHADGRTDRQTDMTKLIAAFHNFANATKSTEMLLCSRKNLKHYDPLPDPSKATCKS